MSGNNEMEEETGELLPGYSTITHFSNEGIKRVLTATRAFQSLPSAGPSWDLQKSYPNFNKAMKNSRSRLVSMILSLLKHANISPEEFKFGDMDEKFDFLVEANDDMLERIGFSLDEALGLFKKAETIAVNNGVASAALKPPGTWGKRKAEHLNESQPSPSDSQEHKMSNRSIKKAIYKRTVREKPQTKFKTPVDNSHSPFVPKLKEKPNSIKPLSILPEYNSKNEEFFGHPYFVELNKWEPLDSMLIKVKPNPPTKLEDTPLIEVKDARDMEQLLRDLYSVTELAIDLEHHGYRSFLGFTCLLQISTRKTDYVIDCLVLRERMYHLNEILTNPKIVKVFHGSSMDIEWLQKDFGLYIVNMFDTQIAARLLGYHQLGLQYLLDRYCNISQNKAFQLADWRIRPLPKEMIHYARQDTHSLLYIYDMLRNELIDAGNEQNNLLLNVYEQSKMMCLKRYEKPLSNPKLALRKMRRSLNNRQVFAFMELYKWRDEIAREKDESTAYVLPNHMLLMISEQLPKEMTGILACCEPVPPLVQSNLGVIHKIITSARNLLLQEHTHEAKSEKRQKLKDWLVVMNSVHDVNFNDLVVEDDNETKDEAGNIKDHFENVRSINFKQDCMEWPLPLQEPSTGLPVKLKPSPSLSLNNKVRVSKFQPTQPVKKESYTIDIAATPFERYQLSQEIMEILRDPKKKESLDLENPVVKAVYETVFCDPTEISSTNIEDIVQKVEVVFTEGDFVPFNPLVGEGSKEKTKRKRNSEWNDNKEVVNKPILKMQTSEVEIIDVDKDEEDGNKESNLEKFMAVSTEKDSKKKRKKGKSNFLNMIKNPFYKKNIKNEQNADQTEPTHKRFDSPNAHDVGQSSKGEKPKNSKPTTSSTSTKNKRSKKAGNKKGKGKFFDFKNRGSGAKSVTFK